VGFSIGFERLVLVLEEKGLFGELASGPDVMICHFDEVADARVLEAANCMREAGVKVEVFPETPKLGKQIAYAETAGAAFAAIIGATEAANGSVSLKNLVSGEQQTLTWQQAAEHILLKRANI
jgi:histidyl-tRNA synthetase